MANMQRMSLRNAVIATVACGVITVSPVAHGERLQQGRLDGPAEHRITAFTFADGGRYTVGMAGTALSPNTRGNAQVKYENGRSHVRLTMRGIAHPQSIGSSYSSYVLWAVTPEGNAGSIGELPVRTSFTFTGTTPLLSFGLMITAEPYATVSEPSAAVVAENVVPDSDRVPRSTVAISVPGAAESIVDASAAGGPDYETPLPLLGARRAVDAARQVHAEMYTPEAWQDAQNGLEALEQSWATLRPDRDKFVREFGASARQLMRSSERARQDSIAAALEARRRADESTARALDAARRLEQAAHRAAFEAATTARDQLVLARREADDARARAEQARTEADREKTRADLAHAEAAVTRATAERIRRDAEAARAAEAGSHARAEWMRAEVERARTTAQRAEADAKQARTEAQEALRTRDALQRELMDALSQVVETRRQDRGVVCSFSDVLFDFDTATLTPGGREKLQKLAGVLLQHHDTYRVEIEGHTDAFGSNEYNLALSQQRAEAVRRGLEEAGVDPERIVAARGVGSASPVASNDTREGRQLNRRVEIVIAEGGPPKASGAGQP
jgi:outer membrane protein OmpA-like peptidoglycan-associated protein